MSKVIPRTLGMREVISCKVCSEIITSHVIGQMVQPVGRYRPTICIQTCTEKNEFVVRQFCYAINGADNLACLVCLGDATQDGAIPTMTVNYVQDMPDYAHWEDNTQKQVVVDEFNRILRYVRALEKGPDNGVFAKGE